MSIIRPEILKAHRVRWYVYTSHYGDPQRELIPRQASMHGFWPGYEAKCSCGWETHTGGAVRTEVSEQVLHHRWDAQWDLDRQREREAHLLGDNAAP